METASTGNSSTILRHPQNADADLLRKSSGHDYLLRSTGRASMTSTPLPDVLGPAEVVVAEGVHGTSSNSHVGNPACRPPSSPRPRARPKACGAGRRVAKRHYTKLFIPSMLILGRIRASVNDHIERQFWLRDNDKTGLADFALESAGAEVVSTNGTESWPFMSTFLEAALRSKTRTNGPRLMLQPGMSPGECWAFRGSKGEAVVRLVSAVQVTAVSLEHISRSVSPAGTIASAPKEFEIWASLGSNGPPQSLGRFVYQACGPTLQNFSLVVISETVDHVGLNVLSNHGHPDYTCVYRLRVHGRQKSCSEDEPETKDRPY